MNVYLPIAEISINAMVPLGLGALVGILSGLFGVGGGFLLTPLLMFIGVPPAVAVATQANQVIATSVSGTLAHWRRGNVDFAMGFVLLLSGLVGSTAGVWLFSLLQAIGQIDLVIRTSFVVFLGTIGVLMTAESVGSLIKRRPASRRRHHYWIHALPFKMKFRKSGIYVSVLLPVALGAFIGVLVAIMGVGGGFVMVPAMIYLLGMPTMVVVGTSLFEFIFVTANVTFLQAAANYTVDIVLAALLMMGGIFGAQLGARLSTRVKAESLRLALALLVMGICVRLAFELIATPSSFYSVISEGG
jgi:uncharacterized membrane protein YfcA